MHRQLSKLLWTLALVAASSVSFVGAASAALQAGDRVDLRVLVLSADGTEPGLSAWTAALTREGVPHDVIVATESDPITTATLQASDTHARYQAVVLASGGLYQCSALGCFSALGVDEWAALDAYQARFSIRRVVAYAYPSPEYGFNYPFASGDQAGTVGQVTAAAGEPFGYLAGPVPVDVGSWGYLATPLAADFQTLVAGPADANGVSSALVGSHTHAAGFDELVVTVAANPYQLHAMLLSHGLIEWVTGGVHLGFQRNYFILHIDDIFLGDDRWDVAANTTFEDGGQTNPIIRMSKSDVDRAIAWQTQTGLKLDMVFNGGGMEEWKAEHNGKDVMGDYLIKNRDSFRWINHTYTHPNLDFSTMTEIYDQVTLNIQWAAGKKLKMDPTELVTGEHSGLANPEMPAALDAAGIAYTGSDNSRQPQPYAIGGATTVPRHPSNVYYNVGTFEEQLDEYNWIYFDNCTNTAVTTCLTAPATWAQYVDSEATIMLRHLLTNDPRPHYFHEANLAEQGTLYPVVNEVLARYTSYLTVPLFQPTLKESSAILAQQAQWDAAWKLPEGQRPVAYVKDGVIIVSGIDATPVPVSGTYSGGWYGGGSTGSVGGGGKGGGTGGGGKGGKKAQLDSTSGKYGWAKQKLHGKKVLELKVRDLQTTGRDDFAWRAPVRKAKVSAKAKAAALKKFGLAGPVAQGAELPACGHHHGPAVKRAVGRKAHR